jgi:hypothetical protein
MDGFDFDTLARAVGSLTTRRLALAALLGGAFGRLGLAETAAKRKSGRCKPKCSECQRCDLGRCRKNNQGKKVCKKSKCQPKATGTPCPAFSGGLCQNGTCVNVKADPANCGRLGNACDPAAVCQNGVCFPISTCPATTTQACPGGGAVVACGGVEAAPCVCSRSTEGQVVCVVIPPLGTTVTPCSSSAGCPVGQACVETGSCEPDPAAAPANHCFRPCRIPFA